MQEPQQEPQGEPQEETQEAPPTVQNDSPAKPQEPITENEPVAITPEPQKTKVPRMLRNLNSGLDGSKWGCSQTHGPRLRVKRTEFEEKFQDSWDNTRPVDVKKTSGED